MTRSDLKVKFLSEIAFTAYEGGKKLAYATLGSSGFDLRACAVVLDGVEHDLSSGSFQLPAGVRCLVKTGIALAAESDCEVQVRPRSGLALKNGVSIVNTPGTVDSDYRGEICVILINHGSEPFVINLGDRIAQAVLCPVIKANFVFVEDLDDTSRSSGGFGSTGVL